MKEIQSVEVSCLVHSTEDEGKIASSIAKHLKISGEPLRQKLEGHFGNKVIYLRYHLIAEDAALTFRSIVQGMERDSRQGLLSDIGPAIDEHSAFYLRLDKQELMGGRLVISSSDPVRIRVKPRKHLIREGAASFYTRQIRQGE